MRLKRTDLIARTRSRGTRDPGYEGEVAAGGGGGGSFTHVTRIRVFTRVAGALEVSTWPTRDCLHDNES